MTAIKKTAEQVIEFIPPRPLRPLAVSVETAVELSGIGKTTIYDLVKKKRLRIVKIGAKALIPYSDLEKLFAE